MKLKVEIELNNAAFKGPDGVEEVERLLSSVAERVPDPLTTTNELNLHDRNGNWVGYAIVCRGQIAETRRD